MSISVATTRTGRIVIADDPEPLKADTRTRHNGHIPETPSPASGTSVFCLGFDWGTNTCCLLGSASGSNEITLRQFVPTVVGYAKDGIVDGLLPGNAKVLFGQEALQNRLHLRLVQPMVDGVIGDINACKDFVRHMRSLIQAPEGTQLRAVIGVPANTDSEAREAMRQTVAGSFDRVILIPEPFLAALGYRDDARLSTPGYVDPVRNSLFIDIGAGTTDVCLVQGYYPTANDQICLAFAGDKVDACLDEAIRKTYPDCELPILKIREIKEKYSYVGAAPQPIIVSLMIGGKMRKLDLTDQVGKACTELLHRSYQAVREMISRAPFDGIDELLQNIIITGGGSRIRNLDTELQRLLAEEGFESPRVRCVGENYKESVASGALKAARQARADQWQQIIS